MKTLEDILKGILLISLIAAGVLFGYQKMILKDSGVERGEEIFKSNIFIERDWEALYAGEIEPVGNRSLGVLNIKNYPLEYDTVFNINLSSYNKPESGESLVDILIARNGKLLGVINNEHIPFSDRFLWDVKTYYSLEDGTAQSIKPGFELIEGYEFIFMTFSDSGELIRKTSRDFSVIRHTLEYIPEQIKGFVLFREFPSYYAEEYDGEDRIRRNLFTIFSPEMYLEHKLFERIAPVTPSQNEILKNNKIYFLDKDRSLYIYNISENKFQEHSLGSLSIDNYYVDSYNNIYYVPRDFCKTDFYAHREGDGCVAPMYEYNVENRENKILIYNLLDLIKIPLYGGIGIENIDIDNNMVTIRSVGGDGPAGWGKKWTVDLEEGEATLIGEASIISCDPHVHSCDEDDIQENRRFNELFRSPEESLNCFGFGEEYIPKYTKVIGCFEKE